MYLSICTFPVEDFLNSMVITMVIVGGGGVGLKRSYCIKLEIQWLERLALILVSQMINMFIARSLVNWC